MTPSELGQAILDGLNRKAEVNVTFTKKDGSETTRTFIAAEDHDFSWIRVEESAKYLNLWSKTDSGYRTIILESIKEVAW